MFDMENERNMCHLMESSVGKKRLKTADLVSFLP